MSSRSGRRRNWKINTLCGTEDLRVHFVIYVALIALFTGFIVAGIAMEHPSMYAMGGTFLIVLSMSVFISYGQHRKINPRKD